jgi:hypothetical protein
MTVTATRDASIDVRDPKNGDFQLVTYHARPLTARQRAHIDAGGDFDEIPEWEKPKPQWHQTLERALGEPWEQAVERARQTVERARRAAPR